jgi:hypothetical protein
MSENGTGAWRRGGNRKAIRRLPEGFTGTDGLCGVASSNLCSYIGVAGAEELCDGVENR